MKFLMFVATDSNPDTAPEEPGEIDAWFSDVSARGQWIAGDRLRPPSEAQTVRVRSGQLLVSEGPFTAAKEQIVGFDLLECETIADAIAIAAKHPMARAGRLEIRQIWPIDS